MRSKLPRKKEPLRPNDDEQQEQEQLKPEQEEEEESQEELAVIPRMLRK